MPDKHEILDGNDLPPGYRWATAEETEALQNFTQKNWPADVKIVPRTKDSNGTPYTQGEADIAVPIDKSFSMPVLGLLVGTPVEVEKPSPLVEVLHVRDPDSACSIRIWIDGVELVHFDEVNVDPGAGHLRPEWDEHTRWIENEGGYSPSFTEAAVAERDGTDSQYIED